MSHHINYCGLPGAGGITAAIIWVEAAVFYENLASAQTQAYGAEARGGATRSEVIIADTPIRFPTVVQPNVPVCLTQQTYNKFHSIIRSCGLLLTDSRYVKADSHVDAHQLQLPMYRSVMEKIGNPLVYIVCMLGAVVALGAIISSKSVLRALSDRALPRFFDLNERALKLGIRPGDGIQLPKDRSLPWGQPSQSAPPRYGTQRMRPNM